MPTLARAGPYRIFMFMSDCAERRHVHVDGADGLAKFWLDPVSLADTFGYSPRQINRIRGIMVAERERLIRAIDLICMRTER